MHADCWCESLLYSSFEIQTVWADVDQILRHQLYHGRQSRKERERTGGGHWFIMVDRIVKEEGGKRERKTDRQAYRHTDIYMHVGVGHTRQELNFGVKETEIPII